MVHPSIKDYRADRRKKYLQPQSANPQFLGQNTLDTRWGKYFPKAKINKTDELFEFELDMPGFKKEDIKINVDDYILTVKAETKYDREPKSDYVVFEYNRKTLVRKFLLNKGIGHEKITADYNDGILSIHFFDVPVEKERKRQKVTIS